MLEPGYLVGFYRTSGNYQQAQVVVVDGDRFYVQWSEKNGAVATKKIYFDRDYYKIISTSAEICSGSRDANAIDSHCYCCPFKIRSKRIQTKQV